jgi:hypothetical protein
MSDGCLLVIARSGDPAVEMLRAYAPGRVAHATVADLSRTGWRYEVGNSYRLSACATGRVIRAPDIAGVLCRIGAVMPSDLSHIHTDDQVYIAAEMNAFLHAWLMQYHGVRFNDPSWLSLAGPSWHPLQWTWLLERLAIPVWSSRRATDAHTAAHTVTATLVGSNVFGAEAPELADYTTRIGRAVRSELLAVTFAWDGEWKFVSADPCPTLASNTAGALVRRTFIAHSAAMTSKPDIACGAA